MAMNISGPPWVVSIPAGNALALTAAQVQAVQALVDGTGIQVAPSFASTYGDVIFDAGGSGTMPTMRAVINAATDVVAAAEIMANSAQAYTTTIDGSGSTGEVMVLATGAVNITSVHVGHSDGADMTLSLDRTITTNEMVRFDFDAVDDVNAVRIHFSPPRGSGRYIDVSVIGQQRTS